MCRVYPNHDNPLYVRVCKQAGRGWLCFIPWKYLDGQWDSRMKRHVEGWMVDAYGQSEKPDPRPRKKSPRIIPSDLMKGEGTDEVALINGQSLTRDQVEQFSKKMFSPIAPEEESTFLKDMATLSNALRTGEIQMGWTVTLEQAREMATWAGMGVEFEARIKEAEEALKRVGTTIKIDFPLQENPHLSVAQIELSSTAEEALKRMGEAFKDLEAQGVAVKVSASPNFTPYQMSPEFEAELRRVAREQDEALKQNGITPLMGEDELVNWVKGIPVTDSPPLSPTAVLSIPNTWGQPSTQLPPFNPDPIDWSEFNSLVPESERKQMYAYDLAQALGFEWDYESPSRLDDLYECLEIEGYEWNGEGWKPSGEVY